MPSLSTKTTDIVDFSKAFDSMDLELSNIYAPTFSCIANFLMRRKRNGVIEDDVSGRGTYISSRKSDVPRGRVLVPLSFSNIYWVSKRTIKKKKTNKQTKNRIH